jgi:hypothetical protein
MVMWLLPMPVILTGTGIFSGGVIARMSLMSCPAIDDAACARNPGLAAIAATKQRKMTTVYRIADNVTLMQKRIPRPQCLRKC